MPTSAHATPRRALIIGASRGIGLGLVDRLLQRGWMVTATQRSPSDGLAALAARESRLILTTLDLASDEQISTLAQRQRSGSLDLVLICGGVMGPDHQRAERATRDETAALFDINAMAPLRCARALLSALEPGQGVMAFISSRMGSVALNDRGDIELYRASKAALNSLTRGFAVNEALPAGIGVLNLHPGWVKTDMGGERAPVTVAQSVQGLVAVIEESLGRSEQRFVDFEGEVLAW
ncbi:short-chain dehydrogenase [Gammaproteobacteria bacterium MFB021]|nr:short-chain dehydrogenase [Gammaproteobacteria bacterium MFB021]